MAITNRKDLLYKIADLSSEKVKINVVDILKGNYDQKLSRLKRELISCIEECIKYETYFREKVLNVIGDIDKYNKMLDEEVRVKLFENLERFPMIINHRVNARSIVDTEVNRIMTLLENKTMKLIDAIYFPEIEARLKTIKYSKDLTQFLNDLIEIEKLAGKVLTSHYNCASTMVYTNPVFRFNEKCKANHFTAREYNDDLSIINDFLRDGFGIADMLENRENKLQELEQKVKEFGLNQEIKK